MIFRSCLLELLFENKIKRLLKRFVDVMYLIIEFKRKVFVLSIKLLLPYSNKCVKASLFMDILQERLPFILEIRIVEKVVFSWFLSISAVKTGFIEFRKLRRNLCSRKRLKSMRSLARYLKPKDLGTLKRIRFLRSF